MRITRTPHVLYYHGITTEKETQLPTFITQILLSSQTTYHMVISSDNDDGPHCSYLLFVSLSPFSGSRLDKMITQAYRLLDPQLFRHNIHKVINDYIMLSTFHVNRTYDSIGKVGNLKVVS